MKRPLGVTLLAIWIFFSAAEGIYDAWPLLKGIPERLKLYPNAYDTSDPWWERAMNYPLVWPLIFLGLTVLILRLGWGLWKLENTARIGVIWLNVVSLLFILGAVIAGKLGDLPEWPRELWLPIIGTCLVVGLICCYLLLPGTRCAFKPSTETQQSLPTIR